MPTGSRPVRPLLLDDVDEWTAECDVAVVGYGIAGASAAVAAGEEGADVVVLERAGGWGGAAAVSGGFIYLGGGTALQQACGFEDSPEEMFKYVMAAFGPGLDEAKARVFCEGSVEHFDWLVGLGVHFAPKFFDEPGGVPAGDESLMYSGGEDAWPFSEIARPAPRGHLPQLPPGTRRVGEDGTAKDGGWSLMEPLVSRAEALGAKPFYDVRADRLVVERDGRVCGVVGRQFGRDLAVRARRGVVLAAGSFAYNDDMLARFAPENVSRPHAAIEAHDGHAIRMGQAVGGDLGRMDGCQVHTMGDDPQLVYRGIVVNRIGQRFVTEDTYPGRVSQMIRYKQDDEAFLVVDSEIFDEACEAAERLNLPARVPPTWVCETVEELEEEVGFPTGTLVATVDLYNRNAERGEDPVLHKKPRWIKPLRSPFGAYDLRNRTAGFPLGGLRISVDGEVIHVDGDPLPGLYAAGRTASAITVWGYSSGISLGDGSFFGRRAGRAAARS